MILRRYIRKARPAAWISRVEAGILTSACERAAAQVGIELPATPPDDVLTVFRSVTLELAKATKKKPELRQQLKIALGKEAEQLGQHIKRATHANDDDAFDLLKFLYSGINIDISGSLPGDLCIHSCYFSRTYNSDTCDLMSAMDEGIMRGLAGDGDLVFSQRITEGCSFCLARFSKGTVHE